MNAHMLRAVVLGSIVLAPVAPALAQSTGPGWPMHEWMWWWGPWHMLMPLLFLSLIVAGVIFLVRKLWPDEQRRFGANRALDLLDERYAKGEIDREEYQRRRQDIQGS